MAAAKKYSLKVVGAKCRVGRNDLPNSTLGMFLCGHCNTRNIMPINQTTQFVECMGCEKWIVVKEE